MNPSRFTFHASRFALRALLLALLFAPVAVAAQAGGDYDLTWNTVDGGGGLGSNGDYTLGGAAGQPDAGFLAAGEYMLSGGFWGGKTPLIVEIVEHQLYLPLVLRNV